MPTPDSGSTASHGSKRRRTGDYDMAPSDVHQEEEEEEEEDEVESPSQPEPDEDGDLRFYNPNQDPEKRRKVRASMRDHQRMIDGAFATSTGEMNSTDSNR
jgi:hypothetical protein